jgi:thioredoxin-dependent peroxiredoxin
MISVDDPETNKKFADEEQADFVMLSDPGKQVAEAYGVLPPVNPDRPDAPRLARRWTFYIGPDGAIRYIDKAVSTATAGEDLAKRLEALNVPARK